MYSVMTIACNIMIIDTMTMTLSCRRRGMHVRLYNGIMSCAHAYALCSARVQRVQRVCTCNAWAEAAVSPLVLVASLRAVILAT